MRKMKFYTLEFVKNMMRRDQHVFVSTTTSGLDVALYKLGFMGWREAAFVNVPLDSLGDDLALVKLGLSNVLDGWHVPSQTSVSWVLPPDIVGVVHNKTEAKDSQELNQIFPFSRDDIYVSKAWNGRDLSTSILWAHKDWVSVFQRTSESLGLQCCELFTRAQLFSASIPHSPQAYGVLIDVVRGESFLHIFNENRATVRSKNLGSSHAVLQNSAFQRELALIGDAASSRMYCVGTHPQDLLWEVGQGTDQVFSELPTETPAHTLRNLALSLQRGIEVSSASDRKAVKTIALLSAVTVGIVLATLVAVLWLDSELKTQIAQNRLSVRKDLAVYEEAKALRLEAMRFAKGIELKNKFTSQSESFRVLADALGTLGPSATLQHFSQNGADVRLSGVTDNVKPTGVLFKDSANFRDSLENDPSSANKAPNATFVRHLIWNEPVTGAVVVSPKVKAP